VVVTRFDGKEREVFRFGEEETEVVQFHEVKEVEARFHFPFCEKRFEKLLCVVGSKEKRRR